MIENEFDADQIADDAEFKFLCTSDPDAYDPYDKSGRKERKRLIDFAGTVEIEKILEAA